MALERFPAAAHEQYAAVMNDDCAHADQRSRRETRVECFHPCRKPFCDSIVAATSRKRGPHTNRSAAAIIK